MKINIHGLMGRRERDFMPNDRAFSTGWSVMKSDTEGCPSCQNEYHSDQMRNTVDFGRICIDCYEELEEEGKIKTTYQQGD